MTMLPEFAMVWAKLVRIRSSRGIWLAKPWLAVAVLAEEVEIEAAPAVLTIRPSTHPREGWAESAAAYRSRCLEGEYLSCLSQAHAWIRDQRSEIRGPALSSLWMS